MIDEEKDSNETVIIESHKASPMAPACDVDRGGMPGLGISSVDLLIYDGTLCDLPNQETQAHSLALAHGGRIVIGRQEGGGTDYLDPHYRPTQRMPGTQQRIVINSSEGRDRCVSRGHFTLVGSPLGILFVNGVPRRGGGNRPPVNGTVLLEPGKRDLVPGEELQIDRGQRIKIRLPNDFEVLISAN